MPIEIRELVIRATVAEEQANPQEAPAASAEGGGPQESSISECVEQVMQILKSKTER